MSTSAQLAQKTKVYIAGTGGTAVNISAIIPGPITSITSAAHLLADGDLITIAGVVGTIGTNADHGLNGKQYSVKYSTTNGFYVEEDTTGLAYTSGGTATPTAWIQVKEVKGIKPAGASTSKVDVTDLDSDAMEYMAGLADNGTISLDINILEADAGQSACLSAFLGSATKQFRVSTKTKHRTFEGSITKFPTVPDASVNGVQTGSMELQISGAVTVADV